MVWQVLVGMHILKPYGLYLQSAGLPDGLLSYNATTLNHIIQQNPSLISQTCYLIADGNTRLTRPDFIRNASMFVDVADQSAQSLVPLHIIPFFTGIFSTPSKASDVNQQTVGRGGVTSFAFNSQPCAIHQQDPSLNQSRQFFLADAAGTSSSFLRNIYKFKQPCGGVISSIFSQSEVAHLCRSAWYHTYQDLKLTQALPVQQQYLIAGIAFWKLLLPISQQGMYPAAEYPVF